MMRKIRPLRFAVAGVVLGLSPVAAQTDDEELPEIHVLGCATACANSSPAVPLSRPRPSFPGDSAILQVEGYVVVSYTIQADGRVGDATVLELVGPQNFAQSVLDAMKTWTFKPAMLDGKPVATSRTGITTFRGLLGPPGARPEMRNLYGSAASQMREGKLDEAKATLDQAELMPKQNFYERGMMGNLASMIAMQKQDYLEARRLSQLATDHGIEELQPEVVRNLFETRIKASLSLGDVPDALISFARLQKVRGFQPDSPIAKLVADARAKADKMPVLSTLSVIPKNKDRGDAAVLGLYRRNFAFANITGSLDRFTLACKQQSISSKITPVAEWHVPKSWGQCFVLVRGAPGTTFTLAQSAD